MSGAPVIVASFALGLVVGFAYFALLARTVRLFAKDAGTLPLIGLYALRAALAIATFLGLAALGAFPLLAGLGGFVVARIAAQRGTRFDG